MRSDSKFPGKELLVDLYVERKLSITQIGKQLHVSGTTVGNWLTVADIERRSPGESQAIARGYPRPNRDVLYRMHVEEKKSCAVIGKELGVTATCVHRWMKMLEIPVRTKSEARRVRQKPVYSPEALERMRARAAAMREKLGPETYAKIAEANRGNVAWNKGQPMREETRQILIAQRADPEYRRHMSEINSGERAWNWKGGQKPEHSARLDRAEWRRIRQEVYARDNWTCQDCGRKCKNTADSKNDGKAKIQAHHIIRRRDGGGDDLANLVTLCMSCHHKRERAADGRLFA